MKNLRTSQVQVAPSTKMLSKWILKIEKNKERGIDDDIKKDFDQGKNLDDMVKDRNDADAAQDEKDEVSKRRSRSSGFFK